MAAPYFPHGLFGKHQVYRVSGFVLAVRIGSHHSLSRRGVLLLSLGPREDTHSLAGEGMEGPDSDGDSAKNIIVSSVEKKLF
jgi:hypothetical protein